MLRLLSFLPKSQFARAIRLGLTAFLVTVLAALSSSAQTVEATVSTPVYTQMAVNPVTNAIYGTFLGLDGATNLNSFGGLEGAYPAAVNPATNKVYSPHGNQSVEVLDAATGNTTTISVEGSALAVGVNPVTNKIYVVGLTFGPSGVVTVIDGATDAVVSTLTAGSYLTNVLVNPFTNKVYACDAITGNIVVLDGDTDTTAMIDTGFASSPNEEANTGFALAVNPVTNKIYVVSSISSNAVVIDGATNTTTQLNLGSSTPNYMALDPLTNKIYVESATYSDGVPTATIMAIDGATNAITTLPLGEMSFISTMELNTVTNQIFLLHDGPSAGPASYVASVLDAVDLTTGKRTGEVSFGGAPGLMALNGMTNKLYAIHVPVYGNSPPRLTVVDGAINRKQGISAGVSPVAVAVNPVTGRVYTADNAGGTVQVTGGSSNAVLATVPVAANPVALAVNSTTNTIYVASTGGNTLTAIDGGTNKATALAVGSGPSSEFAPQSLAVNPVTNLIYLANYASNTVSVINGTTKAVTATVKTGSGPYAVAVNSTTNKIYVANINNSSVTVIDGATNTTSTITTTGSGPIALAVDAAANKIYVANGSGNSVTVIDGATNTTSNVAVGISPYAVGVDPVAHTVYVANYGGKSVTVIDGPTLAATTVATSSEPNAVAVNPVTHMAYVSNITGGSVTAINGAITSAATVAEQGGKTFYTQRLYAPTAPNSSFPAPYAIAVNPATDKVYAADKNGGLFIVDVDRNTTVPLKAVATGVTDASTVSTTNVFQTRNSSPSFTVEVTSSFTSTPTYSGVAGATNPPPSGVYYKVDGGSQWSLATMTSAAGANPASFSINLSAQAIGPHTLYFTPVYGNMGATIDGSNTAPETGNLTAYAFQIDPPL